MDIYTPVDMCLYIYIYIKIYTYICMYIFTNGVSARLERRKRTRILKRALNMHSHLCLYTREYAYIDAPRDTHPVVARLNHECAPARTHACTHTHTHTHALKNGSRYMHSYMHTHTHAYVQTYIHI